MFGEVRTLVAGSAKNVEQQREGVPMASFDVMTQKENTYLQTET